MPHTTSPVTGTAGAGPSAASGQSAASSSKLWAEKEKKRAVLRAVNIDVWEDGPKPPTGSLDSNMKKNTAFIKRVRQSLGVESRDQLVKEVETLNLDKYVDEVVHAIPEGLSKCTTAKDCFAAAESLTALHRRFGGATFTLPLSALLSSTLSVPARNALQALPADQRERDEQTRVSRQKIMLRVVAELALVELTRAEKGKGKATGVQTEETTGSSSFQGAEWLFTALRDMLATDREHTNVPIVLALLKALGTSLLSPTSQKPDDETGQESLTSDDHLLSRDVRNRFRKLFETYYATLSKRIVREYSRLQEQDRRNHEAYIKSGEIFEDRQQNYEKMCKNFEKLEGWGKAFSDLIGLPMPELVDESKATGIGLAINMDSRSVPTGYEKLEAEHASGKSAWEDEDTRRFYEDLVDLAEMVPPSLLSSGQIKAKSDEKTVTSPEVGAKEPELEGNSGVGSPEAQQIELDVTGEDKKAEKSAMGAGPAAQLHALLARLPEMYNRTMVDSMAVDFAFLNSKVARNKLVKQLGAIPRNRSDLVPHYARLIATLNKYMPDIGQGIMGLLDEEFRYLQRKRNVDLAETRSKNMRFIGELTKFQVAPLYTIFHCFKVCLDDFSGPNVENIATLLETCGRYLLRSVGTGERMSSTLEMLRRKRAAQNLDQRQLVLLDNAYYQCNPPEREAASQKHYTPLQLYVNHLIYDVLTKKTQDHVVKMIRKLPWKDEDVIETLRNVFLRAWRIRFSHLHLLAVLLYDLQMYHPDFVVFVIDGVCENLRAGMESNVFKNNQRRVATAKYLAELYNYRLVNSTIIFDQLWSLVTFGHPNGRPLPGQNSPIDAPDDYFRIRLVCTMLDACGHCFDRGPLQRKLDDFLIFFNIYTLSKVQPLPMDVDFMLSDTLEALRPHFKFRKIFEEAAIAVDEMFVAQTTRATPADSVIATESVMQEDERESSETETEFSDDDEKGWPRQKQLDTESESEEEQEDEESKVETAADLQDNDDELEDIEEDELVTRETEDTLMEQEADEEFERELAKMMAESNPFHPANANRNQRGLFDVGMPFIKKSTGGGALAASMQESSIQDDGQHMRFALLSKKGNKHQTHQVRVPIDAAIAVNSRANEKQQLAERQQLKQLVLGIETREQMEDRRSIEEAIMKRGFRMKQTRE